MRQLTEQQIEQFKRLAKQETSIESCGDEWNPYDLSGGNFDDAYQLGIKDADVENARFILDIFQIEY